MNYITKLLCFSALLSLATLTSNIANANNESNLKTTEIDSFNKQANRPTKVKFWYQSDSKPCAAKICLTKTHDASRVAIISHGAFGSPRSMNWLGYALASQGWMVAGIAHYGESWVYGTETIDPKSAMRFWNRPQDLSFTIDSLADSELFNISLETDKVLVMGHSSGGFTALAMLGAKLEHGKSETYCSSNKAKKDKGCAYNRSNQQKLVSEKMLQQIGQLQNRMKDNRVVAAIALDPALGHAASEQSLKIISAPTLVLGSVDNDFLPFDEHAKYYADNIKHAKLIKVEKNAGHFIYIDQCDSNIKAIGVPICKDREGVDRQAIQKQMLKHIFGFILQHNLS